MDTNLSETRLQRALRWHQRLHSDSAKNALLGKQLSRLQTWQSQRLAYSFHEFLIDARSRPAAEFFLSDVYTSNDTRERDASAYRLIPSFRRWLPAKLEPLLADAFMLSALSRALDEKVAVHITTNKTINVPDYVDAYCAAGYFRARRYQIDLIEHIGLRMSHYARKPGVHALLIASRLPARLAGATQLQNFLERGYEAFAQLSDPEAFIRRIVTDERAVRERLIRADKNAFPGFQPNSLSR